MRTAGDTSAAVTHAVQATVSRAPARRKRGDGLDAPEVDVAPTRHRTSVDDVSNDPEVESRASDTIRNCGLRRGPWYTLEFGPLRRAVAGSRTRRTCRTHSPHTSDAEPAVGWPRRVAVEAFDGRAGASQVPPDDLYLCANERRSPAGQATLHVHLLSPTRALAWQVHHERHGASFSVGRAIPLGYVI